MSRPHSPAGSAKVGHIGDLGALQFAAVMFLREWTHQSRSANRRGEQHRQGFMQISELLRSYGRRPLTCHGMSCDCLGADEAWLASLIQTATFGPHEDAMMMACWLVRPDLAPALVAAAQAFGLSLHRDTRHKPMVTHAVMPPANAMIH